MVHDKSLDDNEIIAALLRDVFRHHGVVFNNSSQKNTLNKVSSRIASEGLGFLSKTLPRLGKALDRALTNSTPLNCAEHGFEPIPGSNLPKFLGELFSLVLYPDGTVLPEPSVQAVRSLRQVLYLYYKYELPYSTEQEQQVVDRFVKTEDDLSIVTTSLREIEEACNAIPWSNRPYSIWDDQLRIVRDAQRLLAKLFASFDPKNVIPRHGPGAVATKQQLWEKYRWTNVSANIAKYYPTDSYYYVSYGHICDELKQFVALTEVDLPARVVLVPKDSRGPRLISCEPVDYQWIQQGLGRAIVEHVESTELTKFNVFFTNQLPNQFGALLGSQDGRYATLDLNEASDRVSVDLVRLLFPPHIYEALEACRSSATILPSGQILPLKKFAPMGSCLCFPVMALTIWAILTAKAGSDQDTRESILVYGDDVIVPRAFALDAIEQLESFGLKINRDKSCISGLFRESCGTDAFQGINVTPVRLRTVWSSSRSPESYASWVAYATSFWHKGYFSVYDLIVEALSHLYGPIPTNDMHLACPSLPENPLAHRLHSRSNRSLQKRQWKVWDVQPKRLTHVMDGWSMLLRYFSEGDRASSSYETPWVGHLTFEGDIPFSVSQYTRKRSSILKRVWR